MTKILIELARWIGHKLLVLVIIVGLLLGTAWIANELSGLAEDLKRADAMERLLRSHQEELASLAARRAELETSLADRVGRLGSLEGAIKEAKSLERAADEALQRVQLEKRWYYTKLTQPQYFLRLEAAERAAVSARRAAAAAEAAFLRFQGELEQSEEGKELAELFDAISTKEADAETLAEQVAQARAAAEAHPLERIRKQIVRVLPTALAILAVVVLLPAVVKAVLYFCVAPLMSKARPVVLLPEISGDAEVSPSSVSIPVELGPGEELIVHSDYLQAAGAGPGKRTRFLFSWSMPLTSLAAGLFMMVSVRNPLDRPAKVTISPKSDLFDKISRVRLPEGNAMVVYPRSLVGAVLVGGKAPRITRHWRIFNLHSWITFQFRYLVVHGEAELFLKGCRGVRAGRVEPGESRMQDQCATLGFTANLEYSGIRCETFVDYLRGKDGLFNDRFSNASGYHLTEEIPDPRRTKGLFGRGVEGLVDGILKGFGI